MIPRTSGFKALLLILALLSCHARADITIVTIETSLGNIQLEMLDKNAPKTVASSLGYVNLGNNASNLDNQNGGFTVFARVIGSGMSVVDNIARVEISLWAQPPDVTSIRDQIWGRHRSSRPRSCVV